MCLPQHSLVQAVCHIPLSQGTPLVVHCVPLCPFVSPVSWCDQGITQTAGTRPCWGTLLEGWRVHGPGVPCPVGPRDRMDISVSCRIFWLGGGDAWREVADGMESTLVVRGSGGMPPPPPPPPPLLEKMAALRLNPVDFADINFVFKTGPTLCSNTRFQQALPC